MKILITGSSGYLGQAVLNELKNHTLTGFDLKTTAFSESYFNHVSGDILNFKCLSENMNNIDIVIHLAAKKNLREFTSTNSLPYLTNTKGTQNVIDAFKASTAKLIVFASSASVYGDAGSFAIKENISGTPLGLYGESKLFGEYYLQEMLTDEIQKFVILRIFNICGKSRFTAAESENVFSSFMEQIKNTGEVKIFGKNFPTEDGTAVRDYVHVEDVANAISVIVEKTTLSRPSNSTYNIGTGIGTSVMELSNKLFDKFDIERRTQFSKKEDFEISSSIADISRIKDELKWHPKFDIDQIIESYFR
jgi:UDP-glucose 4-epimerase